jgi:8-oxo-dGTP pyrophosphatase MutT (NUDIX family)
MLTVDSVCVELPAGLVDPGETPQEAALRELKEETGYVVLRTVSNYQNCNSCFKGQNFVAVTRVSNRSWHEQH